MNEEKHKRESKVKKKITKIIGAVIVGGMLMMTAGCGIMGMGSKSWIEKQVSDIEKVYPTENPEDLFEKFPNGFRIEQIRLFKENGVTHSLDLEIKGNKDTKKIDSNVKDTSKNQNNSNESRNTNMGTPNKSSTNTTIDKNSDFYSRYISNFDSMLKDLANRFIDENIQNETTIGNFDVSNSAVVLMYIKDKINQ